MERCQLAASLALTLVIVVMPAALAEDVASEFEPPPNLAEGWYARIDTSMGRIVARLLPEQAPQSVAHFAAMAEGRLEWFDRVSGELKKEPYYDGIKVHKALAGRHFEAGDPRGTGFSPPDLFVPEEGLGPVNFNAPGRLGMTREAGTISAVQFFATAAAQPWLTRNHPCFGVVVSGREVIVNISQVKTYSNNRPIEPPVIERIRIFSVGDPPPLPEPEPYYPRRRRLEPRPNMRQTEPRQPD
jgi:peptidyl-prolyl cis-trans isomerase A (cyclophilin A)